MPSQHKDRCRRNFIPAASLEPPFSERGELILFLFHIDIVADKCDIAARPVENASGCAEERIVRPSTILLACVAAKERVVVRSAKLPCVLSEK